MVINKFISCCTCKEKINIRIQAEDNKIPFIVNCPKCFTEISVEIELSKDENLKLNNATEIHQTPVFPLWCVELSSGLPVRKMYLRKSLSDYELSPFFTTLQQLGENGFEVFARIMSQIVRLNENAKKGLFEDFFRINNLLQNGNEEYFLKETQKLLLNISEFTHIQNVNSLLDGFIVLHQNLIFSGVTVMLGDKVLDEYIHVSKKLKYSINKIELLKYYFNYKETIFSLEKRAFLLIRDFSKVFPQLSPVTLLIKANKYDEINQNKYGISTAIYRDLKHLYTSSYEWLLDGLDIVIALNNISERKNYSKCLKNRNFDIDLQTINSKYQKINQFISKEEPFSKPLNNIKNNVRNGIQHYSDEIDYVNQRISFCDKYKGKIKTVEISLMDFAKLCIENFSWVMYILELIYNLRKFELESDGKVTDDGNLTISRKK